MSDAALICVECGYDLRGLAADSKCPECGESIQASSRGNFLEQCDAIKVARLAEAMDAAAFASLAYFLSLMIVHLNDAVPDIRQLHLSIDWLQRASGIAWWWSVWLLGTSLKRPKESWRLESTHLLRASVIIWAISVVMSPDVLLNAGATVLFSLAIMILPAWLYYVRLNRIGKWGGNRNIRLHAWVLLATFTCALLLEWSDRVMTGVFGSPRLDVSTISQVGSWLMVVHLAYRLVITWYAGRQLWRSAEKSRGQTLLVNMSA